MKISHRGDLVISERLFDIISGISSSPMGERFVFRNAGDRILCTKGNDGDQKLGAGTVIMFMDIPYTEMSFPGDHLCLARMRTLVGNVNAISYYKDDKKDTKPKIKYMKRSTRNDREDVIYVKNGGYEMASPIQREEAFRAEGQPVNKWFWVKGYDQTMVEASRVATLEFTEDDIYSLYNIAKRVSAPKNLQISKGTSDGVKSINIDFASGSSDSLSYEFPLINDGAVGPSYHEIMTDDTVLLFPFDILKCASDIDLPITLKIIIHGGKPRLLLYGESGNIKIMFAVGVTK